MSYPSPSNPYSAFAKFSFSSRRLLARSVLVVAQWLFRLPPTSQPVVPSLVVSLGISALPTIREKTQREKKGDTGSSKHMVNSLVLDTTYISSGYLAQTMDTLKAIVRARYAVAASSSQYERSIKAQSGRRHSSANTSSSFTLLPSLAELASDKYAHIVSIIQRNPARYLPDIFAFKSNIQRTESEIVSSTVSHAANSLETESESVIVARVEQGIRALFIIEQALGLHSPVLFNASLLSPTLTDKTSTPQWITIESRSLSKAINTEISIRETLSSPSTTSPISLNDISSPDEFIQTAAKKIVDSFVDFYAALFTHCEVQKALRKSPKTPSIDEIDHTAQKIRERETRRILSTSIQNIRNAIMVEDTSVQARDLVVNYARSCSALLTQSSGLSLHGLLYPQNTGSPQLTVTEEETNENEDDGENEERIAVPITDTTSQILSSSSVRGSPFYFLLLDTIREINATLGLNIFPLEDPAVPVYDVTLRPELFASQPPRPVKTAAVDQTGDEKHTTTQSISIPTWLRRSFNPETQLDDILQTAEIHSSVNSPRHTNSPQTGRREQGRGEIPRSQTQNYKQGHSRTGKGKGSTNSQIYKPKPPISPSSSKD